MKVTSLPDQETLRALLDYDPTTGELRWKPRDPIMFLGGVQTPEWRAKRWNAANAGNAAFTAISSTGYRHGAVFGLTRLAHRVIWKMVYGEEPPEIDHVNHCRLDNRLLNLRSATVQINRRNQSKRLRPTSTGVTGVYEDVARGAYNARIGHAGKMRHLGSFKSLEAAAAARAAAEGRYDFHPNHGKERAG